jgi:hypothetical protein
MIFILWSHQWKSFWRSLSAGKGLVIQIFLGLITIYLISTAVILGLSLKSVIEKLAPGQDEVKIFCRFVLYYFSLDIILRFLFQDLPVLTIRPYLTLPIRRRLLIRFLNVRSLLNVFNLFPLLLFFPFAITVIGRRYGIPAEAGFLISIILCMVFFHFLMVYIKRKADLSGWWMVGFFICISLLGFADYHHWFSIGKISEFIFYGIVIHPGFAALFVLLAGSAYINNYRFLFDNLYLDERGTNQKRREGANYRFLNRYGIAGELISLDLKLIWRNKRPKSMMFYSLIFIFYGFIFYSKPNLEHPSQWWTLIMGGIFITGLSMINFGSFLISWQSDFFDGLMCSNIPVKTFLRAKWFLLVAISSGLFLISSFYGLIDWKLIVFQLACFLYNIGVNAILLIYFATWNFKRMDISRNSTMNYQGTGIVQWLYILILILVPLGIYRGVNVIFGPWAAVMTLGFLGFASLLLKDWWLGIMTALFERRKYLILKGFREK